MADRAGDTRVLVAGAINTDLVARVGRAPAAGETVTGTAFAVFGGGKGANQAVAAARAGASVAMLGAVGADDFGRQRLADLEEEGIRAGEVATVVGHASGVALIVVEDATGQNRIAYVPGATLRMPPEAARRLVEGFNPTVVLATLELGPAATRALFEAAREQGATVILNATPEAADGRQLAALVDVLVVNETEAADLLGRPVAASGAARAAGELKRLGPSTVVVTLGADGAVAAHRSGTTSVPAPAVVVVDTTGAGDAFCGALAASLGRGSELPLAMRMGVAAGSLAATRAGAQPSMPHRAEVEALAAHLA